MDEAQLNRSKKAAKALKSRVELIERHLKPLLQKDLLDTYNTLPINEKCQMDILLSYAINTLYYMYIRTQGQDPQAHDVFKELKRVQQYIEKIKVAEGRGPKPTMKLDKEAAGRFVKAAINSPKNYERPEGTSKKRSAPSVTKEVESSDSSDSSDSSSDREEEDKVDVKGKLSTKKKARMDPFSK